MDRSDKWHERFARIAQFNEAVTVDINSQAVKRQTQLIDRDPKLKKESEARQKRAFDLTVAFIENGAQLFVDEYLRKFLLEYNHRILIGEGAQLPLSFNVLNAFTEPDPKTLILRLLPEQIFSASLASVLDFLTAPKASTSVTSLVQLLDEFVVYEINMLGGYSDFRLPGHEDFIFAGAAFVREHDELSILGVFGKENPAPGGSVEEIGPKGFSTEKEFLRRNRKQIDLRDDAFFGDGSFRPTILLTRINLADERMEARYVLEEKKEAFTVFTDEAVAHQYPKEMSGHEQEERIRNSLDQLRSFEGLFSFLSLFPLFIKSLQERDDDLVVERHPTKFKTEAMDAHSRRARQSLGLSETPNYVEIRTLIDSGSDKAAYATPETAIKIETRGHWKTLPLGMIGTDKSGNKIHGKSWVHVEKSWFEALNVDLGSIGKSVEINIAGSRDEAAGFIYVMRSAQHPKHVYKIGFTTISPEERAKQLTSETGQPDMFNVVQSWAVKKPAFIEKLIHQRLNAYRVNKSREFFRLRYSEIRDCIEKTIEEVGQQSAAD